MIRGPCALHSSSDDVILTETVGSILKSTGKGFVVWMKDNQIAIEPAVLLQMIIDQTPWSVYPKSTRKTGQQGNLPSAKELDEKSVHLADNETVMLITRLRYGNISFEKGDLQHFYHRWRIPKYLTDCSKREYCSIPDGELHVISDETGTLRYKVLIEKTEKFLGMFSKVSKSIINTFS